MNLATLVLRHADERPEHLAIVFGQREVTYRAYAERAQQIASALAAEGVSTGNRILYYSRNSPEYLITFTAAAWIGAVFTPVHPAFKQSEMAYVASNSRASIAFVEDALLEEYARFSSDLPELPRRVIVVGTGTGREFDHLNISVLDEVLAVADRPKIGLADVSADTAVLISYTSGSTSRPKPVTRTHGSESWNAETYWREWDMRVEDRALISLPLSWVYGLSTLSQALLAAGSTIEILTHFNPVTAVECISRGRITVFGGTNTMYVKILDVYDRTGGDLSSLRNCFIGGEPSSPSVIKRFETLIGSRLWQGYAATEAAPVVLTNPMRDADAPPHTLGRLVPGAELRLVDEAGNDVSPGSPGEALLRCPGGMLSYFAEPELTATRVTEDGWFCSGDLLVEKDSYYFIVGRKSDMIIRGGSNVAPAEVESALTSLEGVVDAVVFGIPDVEYGEQVAAVIVTTAEGDFSDAAVAQSLSSRLAAYKIPTRYFRNIALSEGATGKRDRRAIRDLAISSAATSE